MNSIEQIKRIREQYGFPIWQIKVSLKYYGNDENKAIERLLKIYRAIGDNPAVTIQRNIGEFLDEIRSSDNNEDLFLKEYKQVD